MAAPTDPDDTLVQAELAAVRELKGSYAPLTQAQAILAACMGAWRAAQALPPDLRPRQRGKALRQAAREAIAQARAGTMPRPALAGGVERLPRPQQLVLSLRFAEGMSDTETAAVLGCSPAQVRRLTMLAFGALLRE